MLWIILLVLVAAAIAWISYNVVTKGKAQLKSVEACINQIERNPNSPSVYDKFIEVWRTSTWVQSEDLFNKGYYDRILKICEKNPSYIKVWQLLREVIQRLNITFGINESGKRQRHNTFKLLSSSLFKEFKNQPIRENILSLIHLLSGITPAETQELYNNSLKVLEVNSSSQEAKMLVLNLGRFHYSTVRPDKKPTIYDEQAIQNDIIVRAK